MTNAFYTPTGNPGSAAAGTSSPMRSEFAAIALGFDKMPTVTGQANRAVVINSGGTGLTVTTGTFALAGNFSTAGAFNTVLAQSASITLTLPGVSGTVATLAGTETLSNKTLTAPALGTPASGVLTNCTGTAAGLTAGAATTAINLSGGTVSATTITASGAVSFTHGFTAGSGTFNSSLVVSGGIFTTTLDVTTISATGISASGDLDVTGFITCAQDMDITGVATVGSLVTAGGILAVGVTSTGGIQTTVAFRVGANQVVGARNTGWTAMTGTPDESTAYATSTITLAELAGRVMAIQTALTLHGLLGV